jgi:hypothetical protein
MLSVRLPADVHAELNRTVQKPDLQPFVSEAIQRMLIEAKVRKALDQRQELLEKGEA